MKRECPECSKAEPVCETKSPGKHRVSDPTLFYNKVAMIKTTSMSEPPFGTLKLKPRDRASEKVQKGTLKSELIENLPTEF